MSRPQRPLSHSAAGSRPRLGWGAALALAFALLTAQVLGNWHRVQHGGGALAVAQALAQQPSQLLVPSDVAVLDDAASASVWSHPAGHADCQLLDQLLHADLLPAVALALPVPPAPPPLAAAPLHQGAPLAPPSLYQARAPPQLA